MSRPAHGKPAGQPADKPLSMREQAFVLEYLANGGKAHPAAVSAGYSGKNTGIGSLLLNRERVWRAICTERDAIYRRLHATADEAAAVLAAHLRAPAHLAAAHDDAGVLKPLKDWHPELRASLVSLETEEHAEYGESTTRRCDDGAEVESGGRVLGTVVRKVKIADSHAAAIAILKLHGKFIDKVEHDVTDSYADLVRAAWREKRVADAKAQEPKK